MLGFALCTWVMFNIRSIEELHIYYKVRLVFGLEGGKCETQEMKKKKKIELMVDKKKKVKWTLVTDNYF